MKISHPEFWLIVGMIGLILEVVSGGFWICFLGLGGLLTALLAWYSILPGLDAEILFFVVSSVFLLITLRKAIVSRFNKGSAGKQIEDSTGQVLQVTREIPVGGEGQVEFQGSPWEALSEEKVSIPAGSKVRIVRQKGLKIWVKSFEDK
ncbi:MAG: NfeD family protein [Nitrospirae bacterium]|nr:NfeD family protein [Nitrospirota bacterium]MBI3595208.1 NfeD family protein [Nitrospirota bacterium]